MLLAQNSDNLTSRRLKPKIAYAIIRATSQKVMEANMKRILPIILILIGLTEIILVVMDIKMPIIIQIVLGIIFIALGVKTLIDTSKKK